MTTVDRSAHFALPPRRVGVAVAEVSIAGVPWPLYKVIALAVGMVVLVVASATTLAAATTVTVGAAATAAVWLVLGAAQRADR